VGEKRGGMRGIPGLVIGIIKQLADNLRQMGGRVEPLWRRRDSHPGLSSHFVRVIPPLCSGSSAGPELNNGHPCQPFSAGHDRV
jgi:hypothetical protein